MYKVIIYTPTMAYTSYHTNFIKAMAAFKQGMAIKDYAMATQVSLKRCTDAEAMERTQALKIAA